MRNLSDTLTRLATVKSRKFDMPPPVRGRLSPLDDFGSNPGGLAALHFVPGHARDMPLVVVLHGCTQNASGYDRGTGWTQLADELRFAVLCPEQTRANNFNLCFNWYQTADSRRDAGEPMSIRQMVDTMADRYPIDRSRIHVTGLSAGGAMTSVMLATYPDVFAGGAIVAGLPHGSAATLPEEGKGFRRRSWQDEAGRTVIEDWRIAGMGHGTPVSASGNDACGTGGPYMLDVGISSTREIARSWGLGEGKSGTALTQDLPQSPMVAASSYRLSRPARAQSPSLNTAAVPTGVAKVIEDALRAAGLMR